MKLNEPLFSDYEINGKNIELDLSFNNVLDILEILNSTDLEEFDKLDLIIDLLVYNDIELSYEEKSSVYLHAKETYIEPDNNTFIERDILGNPMPDSSEKTIDFEKDAKFIFASFFTLGINLFEQQGKLTWMEFQALISSLPDDSIMSRIIAIRTWTPQGGESFEYKEQMKKLQKKYSLKEVNGEEVDDG